MMDEAERRERVTREIMAQKLFRDANLDEDRLYLPPEGHMSAEEDDLIIEQLTDDVFPLLDRYNDLAVLYGQEYADKWLKEHRGPPRCPYCDEPAPYGDERIIWLSVHLDSRTHRWWWALKKRVKHGTR
jgi:hypothetical protein